MTNAAALTAVHSTARRQYGVFSMADALAAGVTRTMITHHCQHGRWRRVAPRVYEIVDLPPDWRRPLMAALLWAGNGAVLSHHSAALLHGLDGVRRGAPVHVYSPRGGTHPSWQVHRGTPAGGDVMSRGPLRYTTALRTLADLAKVAGADVVEMALESALRTRAVTLDDVAGATSGRPVLVEVLRRRPRGAPATGSELETRMVQLLRRAGVADPIRQHPVEIASGATVYLDLAFAEHAVFIELDGRATHDRPSALLYDRHRQNDVVRALGWLPLRFTWADVCEHPTPTVRHIVNTLATRAPAGAGHPATSRSAAGQGRAPR